MNKLMQLQLPAKRIQMDNLGATVPYVFKKVAIYGARKIAYFWTD